MNIGELFTKLAERAESLNPAPDLAVKAAFNITGSEPAQWHGRVSGGRAALFEGAGDESPDITISASSETAIGLFEKRVNPLAAFMTGKIKVRGDAAKIDLIKSFLF